jgi:glycosyltransferase involved in cell wall biosynthesis
VVRHGIQQGAPIAGQRRIALVTSSYPANSADYAGAFIPGFAAALAERGCHVTVLTPDKAGAKEVCETHDVRWFKWSGGQKPLVDFSLRSPADLGSIVSLVRAGTRALKELIQEKQIEHCLALWAVPAGYLAWRACRPNVPYSVWALGSDIHTWAHRPVIGSLVRRVLRDADHRFADGIALATEVKAISGRDCEFLPSTRRLPAPAALPHPLGPGVNFLFVGRLEPVKGADVMVDATLRMLASGVDARLTMCGAGSLEIQLRRRSEAAGAADRIDFLGSRPGDVIAAYMSACDCLVIPSRMESIPIVFSEALQAGIPMLVTDVGDMGELARSNGLPEPIQPADADGLAAAMENFARHIEAQRRLYAEARERLLSIFDLQGTADRYLAAIGAA